jgi:hypothetical protein
MVITSTGNLSEIGLVVDKSEDIAGELESIR